MRLINTSILDKFQREHADVRAALAFWRVEVENADWTRPQDIKDRFAHVDFLAGNRVIFNIKSNHYRLVVIVFYLDGIVSIDWVGTHAQYDRQRF
ncbi:type II toxin-antitoxin system HigB family toxin [Silvimonas sp. JCM 19000]